MYTSIARRLAIVGLILAMMPVATVQPASAEQLGQLAGEAVLTVTGDIQVTNVDDTAKFDLEMLRSMDSTVIKTSTIWTEGEQTFTGVSLDVLAKRLGISDGMFRATAINDYTVEIPVSDAVAGGPIIAYEVNGSTMSVRDKGPLWIVYPYDADSKYRSEVVYGRSIWQLDRLEVVK